MNISEYRAPFASFNSSLELARYSYHVGRTSELNDDEIYSRYSDLFSLTAIADLRSCLDRAALDFETDRTGVHMLLSAAQLHLVELQAREATKELGYCESASRIVWRGEKISLQEIPALLAIEPDKTIRHELAARGADSISICDELRIARIESFRESARTLGFDSYRELIAEATHTKIGSVDVVAHSLLEQTQSAYNSALTRLISRDFPGMRPADLDAADQPYFESMPWLDKFFPGKDVLRIYKETMKGLGIRLDKQSNLQIDTEITVARTQAACFRIKPPEDVRLVVPKRDGACLELLEQGGKAQQHAWCSKSLAQRYPEFVYSPDTAATDGYGYLFGYLPLDPKWLLDFSKDVNAVRAAEIAGDFALHLALHFRKLCAEALYGAMLHDSSPPSREQLQTAYVDLNERATSFRPRPELFLANSQVRLEAASRLRSLAFSFGLREYLRLRYGHRWWTSRKAGDELNDLWNTASRYSVEELARLVGFGELSFDLLAEVAIIALRGA